ncbi:MAG: UDP-N-acetylmuramoyl-L-alanine--D-glutamate ligase [Saprospiraceae bacterium]|nr:UDP-N-acetylmuramoyl-L-alanine--D-glutamate ligase [Saprospiraceae bacterium]
MKKRIVILGSGESGTGAALLAKHGGYDVFVSDRGAIRDAYKKELDAHQIPWEEGRHTNDLVLNADEIIKSPGIPEKSEIMVAVRQKAIPVIGEIEFGWRYAGKCNIVAITGSNGKTTTTELTYHLLKTAGLNVRVGGNIGNSFARMVFDDLQRGAESDPSRIFVLEVSSFQLDDIEYFRPRIAMLLNITPDHLDRYEGSLEKYARAKFRITMNQRRGDVFIFNAADPVISEILGTVEYKNSKPKHVAIRKGFYKNGRIAVGKLSFDMTKSRLKGPHNMFNAVCAVRAAVLLGADAEKVQEGLNTFTPPPHRLEVVATLQGVTWINDSKATNVDAVFYALQAMETPTIWIAGGQDKGNDYAPLLPLVGQKVKAIICMGIDNSKILHAFGALNKPMAETRSAEEAVRVAAGFAGPGNTVLLSPACASFDLFKNYEDRGARFREAVLALKN